MKCFCCSSKKKLFESFAELETDEGKIFLCSVCNDLLYKIRDDSQSKNKKCMTKHIKELYDRKKMPQEIYEKWEKAYLSRLKL